MREPLWDRIKQRICRLVGHREKYSAVSRAASCKRCRRLLWTDYERTRLTPPDSDGADEEVDRG